MRYQLRKVLKGYQPLYVCEDHIVLAKRNRLYLADLRLKTKKLLCALPHVHPVVSQLGPRILQRVFRLGFESVALGGDDILYVARRGDIYRVSLSTGEWSLDLHIPEGRRLLNLNVIAGPDSDRALCFGEYFNNPNKLPVNIWRKDLAEGSDWAITTTFEKGEIDHVHAICQALDGSVRILTGDFGDGAGIWLSDSGLTSIEPLLRGSQMIRACWLRQTEPGPLYFATDSQFDRNFVRRLQPDGRDEPETLTHIAGSSIYSAQGRNRIFFSSTVEPGDGTGNFWRDLIDRTPGPGISGNKAAIYGLENGRTTLIAQSSKDAWPMRLAQFGTFQFPQGTMPTDRLFAYGMAVRKFDGATLCFDRLS